MGERVTFGSDGGPGTAYLTRTASARPSPAIVLLPAVSGVNDYVLRRSRKLAAAGYVTLALDYYDGAGPPPLGNLDEILAAVAALDDEAIASSARAAAGHLAGLSGVAPDRIGLMGLCVGGSLALLAAAGEQSPFRGVVGYYGQLRYRETSVTKPRHPIDAVDELACPLLAHFGEDDHLIPQEDVAELRKRTSGRPAEVFTYPSAGHAFDEDFRPVFRPVASTISWTRTFAFLDWCLA